VDQVAYLHPRVKAILEVMNRSISRPLHLMTPNEARGAMRDPYSTAPVNTKLAGNERVTTQTIAGPFGDIPTRIYTPAGDGPFPILVYFHGGGWVLGSLDGVDTICRRIAQIAEVVVISVSYHLAPEHKFPEPVHEAFFVTKWVFDHAHEFQGNPHQLAIGGDSAGANLAAAVTIMARTSDHPKLCTQLLFYPVTSCRFESRSFDEFSSGYLLTREAMEWFRGHYLSKPEDMDNPLASPLLCEDLSGLPPAYIVTAEYDPVRDDGEEYARRLQAAGVPVILRRYEGMIHDFMSFADPPWELDESVQAIDDTAKAVRQLLYGGGNLA
jgi:acetyl esterase